MTIRDAGAMAGGMMRFGIPQYRLPRDVLDAEAQRILDLGVTLELNNKVTNILDPMGDAAAADDGFHTAFLAVGAHIATRVHFRRRGRAHARRGEPAAQHGGRGAPAARPARGRLRRRQHGDGRGARTAKRLGTDEALSTHVEILCAQLAD